MKRSASSDLAGGAKQRQPSKSEALPAEHSDGTIPFFAAFGAAAGLPPAHDMPGAAAAGALLDLDPQQSSAPAGPMPASAVVPIHSLSDAGAAAGMLAAAREQHAAADLGALQQPSHALQHDSERPVAGPHTAAAALEANEGSMAAAQPEQQQQNIQAAAGVMSVTDLRALLARLYPDKQEISAHMLPVRYLAKLLHGKDIDHSTVQLASLLPQIGVLLSHMRDRVAGSVQGKQVMAPHKAAAHAAALQRVLGCAEVQAELGQQQVLQLLATVRAAEQEFEAAERQATSQQQAAPVSTEEEGHAADRAAAAHDDMGSTRLDAGAVGLSVAQLLNNPRMTRWSSTALRQLLLLIPGPEADAAAMQAADLLLQWWLLQAHLQQRVEGKGQEPPLKPKSAVNYAQGILQCLALPSVQAHFSADALEQLQEQVQEGKVQLYSIPDGTVRATCPAATKEAAAAAAGAGADTAAAAAAGAGADTAAAAAAGRPRRGAAAGGMSVAQLLDVLQASRFSQDTINKAHTAIQRLLLLVHGAQADAAAVHTADLLQQWPVLRADLQQRVSGPEPSIKAGSADAVYVGSVLRILRMPEVQAHFGSAALQQLRQHVKADRKTFLKKVAEAGEGSDEDASSDSDSGSEDEWQVTDLNEDSGPLAKAGQQRQVTTFGQLKGSVVGDCRVALNGVAKASGFDEASRDAQPLPAVLQAQHVQGFLRALRERGRSAQHISSMTRHLGFVSQRDDVRRCLGRDSVQQLQQAVGLAAPQQAETEIALPAAAAAASGRGNSKPAASQRSGGKAGYPAGRALAATAAAAAAKAAAASSQPAGQRLLLSAGQPAAGVPASGLSLSQVAAYANLCVGFRTTELKGSLTEAEQEAPSQVQEEAARPGEGEQPAVMSARDATTADSLAAEQQGAAFATAQLAAASARHSPQHSWLLQPRPQQQMRQCATCWLLSGSCWRCTLTSCRPVWQKSWP